MTKLRKTMYLLFVIVLLLQFWASLRLLSFRIVIPIQLIFTDIACLSRAYEIKVENKNNPIWHYIVLALALFIFMFYYIFAM